MTELKYQFLLTYIVLALFLFGCSSNNDESTDEPESAIVKMAQNDPSIPKPPPRPGIDSDIGFDTTKIDDYRLIARMDYSDGNPRRITIGLDKTDKAPTLAISYDENGNKTEEVEFYGKRKNGRVIKWYPNGNLNLVEHYKDDKRCDTSIIFWENGYPKQLVTYENGIRNGLWEQYSERGIKLKQGVYANDSLNGEYTAWNESGRLEYRGFYASDKMSGKWEKYHSSGRIKAVTNYENGIRNGTYVVWDEMGIPMAERFYVRGEERDWPDSIPRAQAIDPPDFVVPSSVLEALKVDTIDKP